MHELGIAEEILGIVVAEANRNQAKKVSAIRLRVGVIRAIEPEHLNFIFEHIAHNTPADGAILSIEEVPVRVECASCGVTEAHAFAWECPKCKGYDISVKGGDTLEIVSIDVEV
ncbi:MAG: hydrogenase maturation nickel metallochaperone HypA [Deltaproteobacteria bacterium]|nr:hydrogenase maturation nickel metallochaperone HypA [Deltaproteobacteria bacterium]